MQVPTNSNRYNSEIWYRVTNALNNSENIAYSMEAAETFGEMLLDWFGSVQAGDAHVAQWKENAELGEAVLKDLLLFAFSDGTTELSYQDTDDNRYLAKIVDGKVSLVKQTQSHEQPVYEFTLRDASLAIDKKNANWADVSSLSKLLSNNQSVLYRAALAIGENEHQLFSIDLVKLAQHYAWQVERAKDEIDELFFPITPSSFIENFRERTTQPSFEILDTFFRFGQLPNYTQPSFEILDTFFRSGQLPNYTAAERCLLAWRCCEIWSNDELDPIQWAAERTHTDVLLNYVLKDVKHLDFTLCTLSYARLARFVFEKMANFAMRHFEGQTITFSGFNIPPHLHRGPEGFWPTLIKLISNPNLTSLHFVKVDWFVDDPIAATKMVTAIQKNVNIKELSFDGCEFPLGAVLDLMAPNSSLISLNIKGGAGLIGTQFWPSDQPALLEALQKNPHLVSFDIGGWHSEQMRAECQQHLDSNSHRYSQYQKVLCLLPHSQNTPSLPVEVLKLIYSAGLTEIKNKHTQPRSSGNCST